MKGISRFFFFKGFHEQSLIIYEGKEERVPAEAERCRQGGTKEKGGREKKRKRPMMFVN